LPELTSLIVCFAWIADTLYAAEPRPSVKAQVLLNQYNTDAHEGRFEDALENSKLAIHYFERLIAGASSFFFFVLWLNCRCRAADADSEGEDWDWRMYLEWYLGLIEAQSSKGFALRQLGYLSLAVEYYRKAIRTHDEVSVHSAVSFLLVHHNMTTTVSCAPVRGHALRDSAC
jgi:tetratricopeptide (TPR) repeat protein